MTIILLFPVLLLTSAFGAVIHKNPEFFSLRVIGTADGVTYYFDNSTTRTWADAKAYCQSNEMQLATINTQNQLDMLRSASFPTFSYWTAGRDADEIRQFTWDHTQLAVPDLLKDIYTKWDITYLSCLYLFKNNETLRLYGYDCKERGMYAFCSNLHGVTEPR